MIASTSESPPSASDETEVTSISVTHMPDKSIELVLGFLACSSPRGWFEAALANKESLLIDHANCEKKAAANAINLITRYPANTELLIKMSQLAREEMLHFQQVVTILVKRGICYRRLSASRYASGLRQHINPDPEQTLVDILIIGALIEARSCERFVGLVPVLEADGDRGLARFYQGLVKSEARHFGDYLKLAQSIECVDLDHRIAELRHIEAELIISADSCFRFHSGMPS
ncbi:MAG: tRNA-(ms[2]io[6]A)-hydroxylase [Gammaproteobacteria bacterium]|nr:tRNA-(ms[2]io[6]A)-hydroxylase [Gammaproteobacteria bacterium]